MGSERTERVSSEQRYRMIAEAAYLRAERRGFNGGDPVRDWVAAEAEIDARLRQTDRDGLLEQLEERLATVGKKLQALSKRLGRLRTDARGELQQDFERLMRLRDTFEKRLAELREHATERLYDQAEKTWQEINEVIQRTSARGSTARRD